MTPDAPQAPDYTGAAATQGQANLANTRLANQLNKVNTNTPWGSLTYTHNTGNGNQDDWTSNITLSPDQQKLLDAQNNISQTEAGAAQGYAQQAADAATRGIDYSKLPGLSTGPQASDFGQYRDSAYNDLMSRQNSQFDQQDKALQQQLINQGLTPGSEAWNRAYQPLQQSRVDASTQSDLAANALQNQYFQQAQSAANMNNQVRGQGIQEQSFAQSNPLNMLNALRSGSQVQQPTFGMGGGGGVQAPQAGNYQSAAGQQGQWDQSMYGANVGSYNNSVSAAAALAAAFISDRRLKRNIVRIGTTPRGNPWYSFEYLWGQKSEGVMSDEVPAEAVIKHPSGFDMVDYRYV